MLLQIDYLYYPINSGIPKRSNQAPFRDIEFNYFTLS